MNNKKKKKYCTNRYESDRVRKEEFSYLERGRNIDPSMNTEPESNMYQLVANSPVLKFFGIIIIYIFGQNNNLH